MDALSIGFGANLALGLFLIVAAVVVVRRISLPGSGALAAYLVLVGANYVLDSASLFLRPLGVPRALLQDLAYLVSFVDPPLLLLFAAAVEGRALRGWPRVALFAPSAFLVALGVTILATNGRLTDPGLRLGYALVLATGYSGALLLLARGHHAARTRGERELRAALVIAFALVVLPRLPLVFSDIGFAQGRMRTTPDSLLYFEGALAALSLAVAAWFVATAPREARPAAWRATRTIAPLLGLVIAAWMLRFVPGIAASTFALMYSARWFVFAAIFAFGMRRHEVLGIPARLGARTRAAVTLLLAIMLLAQMSALFAAFPEATPTSSITGGAIATAVFVGSGFALWRRGGEDEARWRRLRIYRAHVELETAPDALAQLRHELGVTDTEASEEERLVAIERATAAEAFGRLEVGATFADRYEVRRVLGAGAVGLVYAGRDRVSGAEIVLKELRPDWRMNAEAVRRLRREAQLALRVSNPHVVSLLAIERGEDGDVLVMERVPGETLRARLARGTLTHAEAHRLAADLLDGLAALHRVGALHRDVKPENVILRPNGGAVLVDLGAAGDLDSGGTRMGGEHPGTPAYMSPEQRRGERIGPASDVYAVGVLLWEALAGAAPPERSVPEAWALVLSRALDPDAAARWQSAEAFRAALPA